MWSSQGSVATFPSEKPAMRAAVTSWAAPATTSTLVFRLDPQSGIVYLTGTWTRSASLPANGSFFDTAYRLPAAFTPVTQYQVLGTGGNSNSALAQMAVTTAGQLIYLGAAAITYAAGSQGIYAVNGSYFTDV